MEIILTQVTKKEHLVDQAAVEEEMVDLQVQVFNQTNLEILEHMVLVILEQAEQLLTLLDMVVAVVELAAQGQARLEEQEKRYLHSLVTLEILDLTLEEELVVETHHKADHQQEMLATQEVELQQETNLILMVKLTLEVVEKEQPLALLEDHLLEMVKVDLV